MEESTCSELGFTVAGDQYMQYFYMCGEVSLDGWTMPGNLTGVFFVFLRFRAIK